jgi:hypothetical protein
MRALTINTSVDKITGEDVVEVNGVRIYLTDDQTAEDVIEDLEGLYYHMADMEADEARMEERQ